ncbi:CehA/McbA family metallohydrolase [Streptomyces sp. NPDC096205]|uniref:CehA/McbA family metallohydrolase n=1 Tax=Streptomyces sp. NPDC096205 TaxID=3366081 RepID=UPI003817B9D7
MLPAGSPDHAYEPFDVPPGVREVRVAYTYDRSPGNALDLGLFDERGTGSGFRGWSGGARTEFFVRADEATPGYLPGPPRPGTWHIALGPYTVAPQGLSYEITLTLTYGEPGEAVQPVYPPERASGRGRAWYRGDLHLHSWHSDGRRTPAEIGALARAAGLDFVNSSEHNTTSAHAHWADVAGDDLLVLLGEEVTTRNGHLVALGTDPGTFVDWRFRARDDAFGRTAATIRAAGGLAVPAHPHAPCVGCAWKHGWDAADAVEVWNGPWTPDDEVTLAAWDAGLAAGTCRTGPAATDARPDAGPSETEVRPDADLAAGAGRTDDADTATGPNTGLGAGAWGTGPSETEVRPDADLAAGAGRTDDADTAAEPNTGLGAGTSRTDPATEVGRTDHADIPTRPNRAPGPVRLLPAVGGSDAHRSPDRVGLPQTVVLADDLTRAAVLAGIRAGHCYVAESSALSLDFTARAADGGTAGIGGRLAVAPDTPVTVRVAVTGALRCTVRLVTDQGVLHTSPPLPVTGSGVVEWRTTPARATYVRAEVRHEAALGPLPGVMAAFTNPVFLGP